jgi:hypothetical protein
MCDVTMRPVLIAAVFLASTCWAVEPEFVIGSRNPHISDGARALLGGRNEEGIRLTLIGLKAANGKKEEEIALSNLCAGYTNLGDYETALKYCDILLQRNDTSKQNSTKKLNRNSLKVRLLTGMHAQ